MGTKTGDSISGKKSSNVYHIHSYRDEEDALTVLSRLTHRRSGTLVRSYQELLDSLEQMEDSITQQQQWESQPLWCGEVLSDRMSSVTIRTSTSEAMESKVVATIVPASTARKPLPSSQSKWW